VANVDLSILICSLHDRQMQRNRLMSLIAQQPPDLLDRCQVLVDIDNGQISVGAKRNRLLDASIGTYVVFIDDDDTITENYLGEIFTGIDLGVDHIGVSMWYMPIGQPRAWKVECSKDNEWTSRDGVYLRPPQHVCAVKRELALQIRFPDISFGEDRQYSERLKELVKTEYLVPEPIYHYLYVEGKNK
jgi:hypothetical protein